MNDGYCNCGCGDITNLYRGKFRKFIYGHQARGENNPRFGVILSEEIKNKISNSNLGKQSGENNSFFGMKHTQKTKDLMSQKGRGIAKTPRKGIDKSCSICNTIFYVPQYRKELKKYCSVKCANIDYSDKYVGENNPFYGKIHSEETKEILRQKSSAQRSRKVILPSKPEKIIHEELFNLNIAFETEKLINDKFCVDIFIPKYNLIIYIDGCYWHACPTHCPNAKKPNSDNARIPYLSKCGYNIEILWEHDIKCKAKELIDNICQKYNIQLD